MNYKNLLCMIALFAGLLPSNSFAMRRSPRKNITRKRQTEAPVIEKNEADINNEIDNEVQKILEWAATEKELDEDAFNNKKNTSPFLNPTENDSPIMREAKKRAKDILFPQTQPQIQPEYIGKIADQVRMILEWAQSKSPEELGQIKDTSKLLNPQDNDTEIQKQAKEIAKKQLFSPKPTKSYWQSYAPQFMQDATTATSNYVASWIPQSVKDRINSWSTRKKIAIASAIIASLALIYNKDTIMGFFNNILNPQKPAKDYTYTSKDTYMTAKDWYASKTPEHLYRIKQFRDMLTQFRPNLRGPSDSANAYQQMFPSLTNDPDFQEAIRQLKEQNAFNSWPNIFYTPNF